MLGKMLPQITISSVAVAAVVVMLFALSIPPLQIERDAGEQVRPPADRVALVGTDKPAVAAVKQAAEWFGLCPAYAATTVAGFKAQVMNDPQLMEHYRNFDWGNALIFENQEDAFSSVLYKKNGSIYWTRKPLLIKKGEKILTDGKVQIRTYCCNQLALVPMGPFLPPPEEPPAEEIQPPEAPGIPEFPLVALPPMLDIPPSIGTFIPPPTPPPLIIADKRTPRRRPIPVPEPATLMLLVSGLGVLVLHHRRRRPV